MRLRLCRQPLLQGAGQSWDPQNPMQRQGMMPNAITCTALISSCQNGNHPEQALELFKNMQRPKIKIEMKIKITIEIRIKIMIKNKNTKYEYQNICIGTYKYNLGGKPLVCCHTPMAICIPWFV